MLRLNIYSHLFSQNEDIARLSNISIIRKNEKQTFDKFPSWALKLILYQLILLLSKSSNWSEGLITPKTLLVLSGASRMLRGDKGLMKVLVSVTRILFLSSLFEKKTYTNNINETIR